MNWCPGMTFEYMEREAIKAAMKFYQGDKQAVALSLGISIRTLHNKLAQEKDKPEKKIEDPKAD